MAFEMKCNMCGVVIQLDESRAGSMINCPSCGQVIFVQQAEARDIAPVKMDDLQLDGGYSPPLAEIQLPDNLPGKVGSAGSKSELLTADALNDDTSSSLVELIAGADSPNPPPPAATQATPTQEPGMPREAGSADDWEYRGAEDNLQTPHQAEISARGDWYVGDVPVPQVDSERLPVTKGHSADAIEPQSAAVTASDARRAPLNFATLAAVYMCGVVSGLIIGSFIFR
jgi:predicted RNA-binding Zn-ribbon protein involved in translation (DUF1610 family)